MNDWLWVAAGSLLAAFSLFVELRHKQIWARYERRYRRPKSALVYKLTRPNMAVYRANIYIVWPMALALGLWIVASGVRELAN